MFCSACSFAPIQKTRPVFHLKPLPTPQPSTPATPKSLNLGRSFDFVAMAQAACSLCDLCEVEFRLRAEGLEFRIITDTGFGTWQLMIEIKVNRYDTWITDVVSRPHLWHRLLILIGMSTEKSSILLI